MAESGPIPSSPPSHGKTAEVSSPPPPSLSVLSVTATVSLLLCPSLSLLPQGWALTGASVLPSPAKGSRPELALVGLWLVGVEAAFILTLITVATVTLLPNLHHPITTDRLARLYRKERDRGMSLKFSHTHSHRNTQTLTHTHKQI